MPRIDAQILARLLAPVIFLLAACEKKGDIPAWIVVDSYDVVTEPGQGTAHHHITEVYAYTPSAFLGAFNLPCRIPVLETGMTNIDLFPGIRANGIAASPDVYGFLGRFSQTVDLQPGKIDTLRPVFRYDPEAIIRFAEDFDGGINYFSETRIGYPMVISAEGAFEGSHSALIRVDTAQTVHQVVSIPVDNIPYNGTPIYVELHYKCDVAFFVGFTATAPGFPEYTEFVLGLNPRQEWTKVYISLLDILNLQRPETVRITFRTELPLFYEGHEANVWLDNIKLVHQ
jgi:hypothetical protein